MTDKPRTEDGLQRFFDAGRAAAAEPGGDLLARITAQALAEQQQRPVLAPEPGVWALLMRALGGWPAMAGFAAAACTGVWLGFAPPEAVLAYFVDENVLNALDPISGYDFALLEG